MSSLSRYFLAFFMMGVLLPGRISDVSADQGVEEAKRVFSPPTVAYDTGSPLFVDVWVDAVHGDDANDGSSPANAFRTLLAAWNTLPIHIDLTEAVRINIQPGVYTESMLPVYWESRHGTFASPIMIRGNGVSRDNVVLQGMINMYDSYYVYFENLSIAFSGDNFHCELCDHVLLRNVHFDGRAAAQETIKVNQTQYFYIENSDIANAYENVIDYVAVQYGHIINSHIHGAGDWCAYVKGGSAYILLESNRLYTCGTGGFTAGQGTGFQYMVAPWLHYEAYDIKVINNLIYNTDGAGLGVNGGYNILLAYNTMYHVGGLSHVLEVVYGYRSCDGQPGAPGREKCQQYLEQGGWGTTVVDDGSNAINIPNKNIFIYNNIVYNPPGYQSQWSHFAIYDPRINPVSSHIPNVRTDENLKIRGNLIWNGSVAMPLGIEGSQVCKDDNPTCNQYQLLADNRINFIQPKFLNPFLGDFHPTGTWMPGQDPGSIPDFPAWDISGVPAGTLENTVMVDQENVVRSGLDLTGALVTSIVTQAAIFTSEPLQDGWILESNESSGTGGSMNSSARTFSLGDDFADRQYRAILHFNTAFLPENAIITRAVLRIKRQGISGSNPFNILGPLRVDMQKPFFGAQSLMLADFRSVAGKKKVAVFDSIPMASWYSADLSNAGMLYINRLGPTQFRLYFSIDDNDDIGLDFMKFYSGDNGIARRPQLVVEYYVP